MLPDVVAGLRAKWPDAPTVLLEYVASRVVLVAVLRQYNRAAAVFDDAMRDFSAADTRLARLEGAAAAERARVALARWTGLLVEFEVVEGDGERKPYGVLVGGVALVCAVKRARYDAWKGLRTRAAERRGLPPPPAYVLPEDRGDAFEAPRGRIVDTQAVRGDADRSLWMFHARATLRIWSRYYATHAQS